MASVRVSFILFAFVLAAMIVESQSANEQTCGVHETFSECGTECQRTCADIGIPGKMCNHMCAIGCFCESGYVRKIDQNSPCIKETEC